MGVFGTIGIEVSTATTAVKATMVAMSCDLPARALVLNMRQFNGEGGCHLCEDPGKNSAHNPMLRWWPYNKDAALRTKNSLLKNSGEVALHGAIVSPILSMSP